MKKLISILIVIIMIFSLCSCGLFDDKVHTIGELSITLPFDYIEVDIDGFDSCYGNSDISILIIEESIDSLAEQGLAISSESSLDFYMDLIVETNSEDCGITKEDVVNEDGLLYYVWSTDDEGEENYTYFSVVYKSTSSFWFVQIATTVEDYEELLPQVKEIAKSVVTE